MSVRVCIDVPSLEAGIAFYASLGLTARRRFGDTFVEMAGAGVPIDLVAHAAGTTPAPGATRGYERHWTPVHLDFVVEGLEDAVARAVAAGARVEREIASQPWGRIAILADPFGHGLCLLEFRGRGYEEL